MSNEDKKFIGPDEVLEVKVSELKTPLGAEVFEVFYVEQKDDKGNLISPEPELITKKMFDQVVSSEKSDYTTLRGKRLFKVQADILGVLAEWNVRYNEIEFLFQLLQAANQQNLDMADKVLFGVSKEEKTLLHVHDILTQNKQNARTDDNKGSSQEA